MIYNIYSIYLKIKSKLSKRTKLRLYIDHKLAKRQSIGLSILQISQAKNMKKHFSVCKLTFL